MRLTAIEQPKPNEQLVQPQTIQNNPQLDRGYERRWEKREDAREHDKDR